MTTDELLLDRYATDGDPAAFRGLVERYAGLVYGISLRITGDRQMAEDVSQECFFELACKARTVRENVAGWLHSVATSRSLNVLRARKRRAQREQVKASGEIDAVEASEWSELQPLIDRALNGLSDDLRLPIIYHYLQGQSQQQVAERLGTNQATVSRRLQRGVEALRQRLQGLGVMTTVAAVTSLFGQSSAQAASTSLTMSLAKIGVGGVGVTVAKSSLGGVLSSPILLIALAGNVLLGLLVQGWLYLLLVAVEFALLARPPGWLRELLRAQSFGRDVVAHPMYPFHRWNWTIPPYDWKQRLFVWSFVGVTFGLTAYGKFSKTAPGFSASFGLMAILFLTLVVRLAWCVWKLRDRLAETPRNTAEDRRQWTSWESVITCAVAASIAATWLWSMPANERFALSIGTVQVWIWFAACSVMGVWALLERWRQRDDDVSSDGSSAQNEIEIKPVAGGYHFTLIAGLVLMVSLFLASTIVSAIVPERPVPREPLVYRYTKEGARVRVEVPDAFRPASPPKGLPSQPMIAASMGLMFGLLLWRRVVKLRDQLPRSVSLPLVSFSVLAVSVGVGMTAYGLWKSDAGSKERTAAAATPEHQASVPQPTPSQIALIQKYAEDAKVITVPDEQLPDGWYIEREPSGFEYPLPHEGLHGELARSLGLTDVPELHSVVAKLTRLYVNPFAHGGGDSVCAVYAFVCPNSDEARRLNAAWGDRGLCAGRLVIFVKNRQGLRAPSLDDRTPIPALFEHIQRMVTESTRS